MEEPTTPCTTQTSFGRAVTMVMTTSCPKNHVPVSRRVRWTFDVDHLTMAETHVAVLTIARYYCSELRNLRQTFALVPLT